MLCLLVSERRQDEGKSIGIGWEKLFCLICIFFSLFSLIFVCSLIEKKLFHKSWSASPNSVIQNLFKEDHSVNSFFHLHQNSDNDSLLRVQVESSIQKTTFYVSVSLMLQREVEMQDAAKKANIDPDRWASSRLFALWKEQAKETTADEITLKLDPEQTMKDYSSLKWEPWLTTCIRAYYNTGTIRIPDDCLGSEVLLALEFFGILTTSTDPFVFDSYGAYERVKIWSDYFTLRNMIASWVLDDLKGRGDCYRVWVTSPNALEMVESEFLLQVRADKATVLSGGLEDNGIALSCRLVHEMFSEKESDNRLTRETPARLREDFCEHLQRSLPPNALVTFVPDKVVVTKSSGRSTTETRCVLKIQKETTTKETPSSAELPNVDAIFSTRSKASSVASSSSENIAKMLGFHGEASNKKHLSDYEKGILGPIGTRSVDLSMGSSAIADRLGLATSNVSGHPHAPASVATGRKSISSHGSKGYPFDEPISRSRSYSSLPKRTSTNSSAVTNAALMRQSQSSAMAHSNSHPSSIEQRHPARSTPPPDERRSSPENLTERRELSDLEFLQQIDNVAPIRFINTAFGDLQSVTSGLSGPFMDDSVADSRLRQVVAATSDIPSSTVVLESCATPEINGKKMQDNPTSQPSQKSQTDDAVKPCDYWDRWLTDICAAVIPGALQERPSSPVETVTMRTNTDTAPESITETADQRIPDPAKAPFSSSNIHRAKPKKDTTGDVDASAAVDTSFQTVSVEGMTANWLRSALTDGSKHSIFDPDPKNDNAAGFAKSKTESSNPVDGFDEFIKITLSNEEKPGASLKKQAGKKVPERLPLPPRKSSTEKVSKTESNKYSSEPRGQANKPLIKNMLIHPLKQSRQEEATTIREDHGRRSSNSSQPDVAREVQERRSTISVQPDHSSMGHKVKLPIREPRRMRVPSPAIARKKSQSLVSTVPPRYPSDSSAMTPSTPYTMVTSIETKRSKNTLGSDTISSLSASHSAAVSNASGESKSSRGRSLTKRFLRNR